MDDWAWDIVYVHVYSEIRNKVTKKNSSRGMDAVPDPADRYIRKSTKIIR